MIGIAMGRDAVTGVTAIGQGRRVRRMGEACTLKPRQMHVRLDQQALHEKCEDREKQGGSAESVVVATRDRAPANRFR